MTVWADENEGGETWTFPAGDAGELVETDDRAHVRKLVYGSRVVTVWPYEPEPVRESGGKRGGDERPTPFDWLLIAGCWAFAAAVFGLLMMALGYDW